jgi:hypothetical protein
MGRKVARTTVELIDAGYYNAVVEEITPETGQFGPQLKFKFRLVDFDPPHYLLGWCSEKFNPKTKLWEWVRATTFGGKEIPEDYIELDLDEMINKPIRLNVTEETGEKGTYNKVVAVLPPPKTNRPTPRQMPAEVEPEQPPDAVAVEAY